MKPDTVAAKAQSACGAQRVQAKLPAMAKAGFYDQVKQFFSGIFNTDNWPPRWHCGTWSEFHGWLYILAIYLSRYLILQFPYCLLYF